MNKKILLAFVIAIILVAVGYAIHYRQELKRTSVANSSASAINTLQHQQLNTTKTNSEPVQTPSLVIKKADNWKTYTNSKLGFTFQYSSNWHKEEKDVEVVNRSGDVIAIEFNFTDAVTQTSLLVAYNFPPNGQKLYEYAASQLGYKYAEGTKHIDIAGTKAIQAVNTIKEDGRGHTTKPIQVIVIDFLDKKNAGEIQMQFRTPLPSELEVAKFNQLLSSFNFINP